MSAVITITVSGGGGDVTNPLSADLDVGGFSIIGASPGSGPGGSVTITAGTSVDDAGGDVNLTLGAGATTNGNLVQTGLPTADPMVTGAVWLDNGVWVQSGSVAPTSGIAAVVDDPSPVLGGNLNVNGNSIRGADGDDGGNLELYAGAGAVNNGGTFLIEGGAGEIDGGNVNLLSGAGTTGNGGSINLTGRSGAVNGGSVGASPGTGGNNGGDFYIELPGAGIGRQGLILISNLPTSDPGVPTAIFSLAGVLKISP